MSADQKNKRGSSDVGINCYQTSERIIGDVISSFLVCFIPVWQLIIWLVESTQRLSIRSRELLTVLSIASPQFKWCNESILLPAAAMS